MQTQTKTHTNTSMKSVQILLIVVVLLIAGRTSTTEGFISSSNRILNKKLGIGKNLEQKRQPATGLNAQIFVDLLNEYQYLTNTFPLPTQSATFGTFAGVGDALAQQKEISEQSSDDVEEEHIDSVMETTASTMTIEEITNSENDDAVDSTSLLSSFDGKRTQRFVLKGFGAGLIWSQWYPVVDGWSDISSSYVLVDLLTMDDIGTAHIIAKTVSSILMEQFIACPIVYSLWDIPIPAYLAGTTDPSKLLQLVKDKVPGLLLDNAKVWTLVNIIVYNLPVQWRVFAVSIAEIFWASIVSSVATSGASQVAFIESQDALLGQIVDNKVDKVVEATLSPTATSLVEKKK